jgi:chemotaxis protein MotB
VTQVRGFADQRLRKSQDPFDPSNRRISVIVQYIIKNSDEKDEAPEAEEKTGQSAAAPAAGDGAKVGDSSRKE